MKKISLSQSSFLVIILISMAISPTFALGEGNRNLFLIGVMAISPIIIIMSTKFDRSNIWLWLFMVSIILLPLLNQPASMRWSTVLYSIMFCLTFIAYKQLLRRKKFTIGSYQKLLKNLIYAYFIVLLIQQFCVLTGLPIFNINGHNPMQIWKLNSLASEPSHSARIVAFLMYCYITIKEITEQRRYSFHLDRKDDRWLWLAFLWTMTTMGSGTAFLFIAIVLLKFIRLKTLLPLFVIVGVIVFFVNIMGITSMERTFKVFIATLTFDIDAIVQADHSASLRIIPMMILVEMVDLTTLNGWFGHGVDYVSSFLYKIVPGVPEGFSGGGLIAFLMDYGFISFILFGIFSFSNSFRKDDYLSIIFWFMLVFMYGINSQIVWLTIILLFTNNFFIKMDNRKIERKNIS